MKILVFELLVLAFLFVFQACTPEKENNKGSIELKIIPKFDGHPYYSFNMFPSSLSTINGILFKKLEFFISNIQGINLQQETIPFETVSYLNFTNLLDSNASKDGISILIEEVDLDEYQSLNFSVGLPDYLNETQPGDYNTDSPLAMTANYWASWNSYILCKIEGDIKNSADSTIGFLYHAGVNGMLQTLSFPTNFEVQDGQATTIELIIDVDKIFFETLNNIDMINDKTTHSGAVGSDAYNLALHIMENLSNSLRLK